MSRIMEIIPDPRCVKILEENSADRDVYGGWYHSEIGPQERLRTIVEQMVSRDLLPVDWLDTERLGDSQNNGMLGLDRSAIPIAFRNTQSMIDAEGILRHGIANTCGRYVGIVSWYTLENDARSDDNGIWIPSSSGIGREITDPFQMKREWFESIRDSEYKYGDANPMVWSLARQIAGGPAWISDLYRTGFGLWLWRATVGMPEWVLVVRKGDGFAWPRW